MAGNYSGDIGSYSHPQFTEQRTAFFAVLGVGVSQTQFAQFSSRNKILVNRVSIMYTSSPSSTSGTLAVIFYDTALTATTLKTLTVSSCSAGFATTVTFTAVTLETLSQHLAITALDKGDVACSYEYQLLYPETYA
jgi:hypothetical protein